MQLLFTNHRGGTFDQVVSEYEKPYELSSVYVALGRVISINGLFIIPRSGEENIVYHILRIAISTTSLRNELVCLNENSLKTIHKEVSNYIKIAGNILFFS